MNLNLNLNLNLNHYPSLPRRAAALAVAAGLLLWHGAAPAGAADSGPAKPLELRKIMQDLGRDMRSVSDAIAYQDWVLVTQLAPRIAAHPEPRLSERLRILAYLGGDAASFKNLDQRTHEAAQAMEQAAARGDRTTVIRSYGRLQESCMACHQTYRPAFVEHFYGSR